jgi:hypothetical protein
MSRTETLKTRQGITIQRLSDPGASKAPTFVVKDADVPGQRMTTTDELAAWMRFDGWVAEKLQRIGDAKF